MKTRRLRTAQVMLDESAPENITVFAGFYIHYLLWAPMHSKNNETYSMSYAINRSTSRRSKEFVSQVFDDIPYNMYVLSLYIYIYCSKSNTKRGDVVNVS